MVWKSTWEMGAIFRDAYWWTKIIIRKVINLWVYIFCLLCLQTKQSMWPLARYKQISQWWQCLCHMVSLGLSELTHLPLVLHICVSELGHHWFRYWPVAYSVPSHYLNQCWFIVKWDSWEQISVKFVSEFYHFHPRKCIWKCCLQKWWPFCPGEMSWWRHPEMSPISVSISMIQNITVSMFYWWVTCLTDSPSCHFNSLRPRQNGCHFQTTFSDVFSWMKMYKFQLRFHWGLSPRVQSTIFQHWFR